MSTSNEERVLWQQGDVSCVMVSCCAGAELQIRRVVGLKLDLTKSGVDVEIVLRELYPMKSDLYERARALEAEYQSPTIHPSRS